jgi:hypothetical protein
MDYKETLSALFNFGALYVIALVIVLGGFYLLSHQSHRFPVFFHVIVSLTALLVLALVNYFRVGFTRGSITQADRLALIRLNEVTFTELSDNSKLASSLTTEDGIWSFVDLLIQRGYYSPDDRETLRELFLSPSFKISSKNGNYFTTN